MSKTVLIRRPQVHGNVTRMVRATVLSENNGEMRVIPEGTTSRSMSKHRTHAVRQRPSGQDWPCREVL